MNIKIIVTGLVFLFLLVTNYKGAVGRIERENKLTGEFEDLGPVSEKEKTAFIEGRHKRLALIQALIGSLIWSGIVFGLMSIFI